MQPQGKTASSKYQAFMTSGLLCRTLLSTNLSDQIILATVIAFSLLNTSEQSDVEIYRCKSQRGFNFILEFLHHKQLGVFSKKIVL